MQRLPRVKEDSSIEEKFKVLYDWCFLLSQEIADKEEATFNVSETKEE